MDNPLTAFGIFSDFSDSDGDGTERASDIDMEEGRVREMHRHLQSCHRLLSIYGIGNGITCAIVPHSNAPETLPRILSARKDLVKGHLSRTFD